MKRYMVTLPQKTARMNCYGKGPADVYWVDTSIIETYKPNKEV